jgi:hypothetical protein
MRPEIHAQMTLKELLPFCFPAQAMNLKPLAEMFDVKLCDFQIGHVVTYQTQRATEMDPHTIDCEVGTLLHLLEGLGLGEELRKVYRPLKERDEPTPEEREALPERVRLYIEKLERELRSLRVDNERVADRLRRANWARWRG